MKFVLNGLAAAIVVCAAAPALAAPKPVESWGRAGVDFETYRTDAIECAASAYYADVSETEQAKAFLAASKRLEATDNGYTAAPAAVTASSPGPGSSSPGASAGGDIYQIARTAAMQEQIKQSIRPEKRIRELQSGLQSIVDTCLVDRGYSKFSLTEEQRDNLGKLKKGSDERFHYMHSLASNAQVLETQEISG